MGNFSTEEFDRIQHDLFSSANFMLSCLLWLLQLVSLCWIFVWSKRSSLVLVPLIQTTDTMDLIYRRTYIGRRRIAITTIVIIDNAIPLYCTFNRFWTMRWLSYYSIVLESPLRQIGTILQQFVAVFAGKHHSKQSKKCSKSDNLAFATSIED